MKYQPRGWFIALAAVILYSINSPVARAALIAGIDPATLLVARFIFGSLLFGVTLPLINRWQVGRSKITQKPIDRKGIAICIGSGLANGLTLLFLYYGLETLEASLSSVIMIGLVAGFTLSLLRLWRMRPRWIDLFRLIISVIGLVLLLGPGGRVSWGGVGFTILAAFFFAVHVVTVQIYLKPYRVWTVTALIVFSATIFATLIWGQAGFPAFVPGWVGWGAIIFQAVVATYLGRLLTYAAIGLIGSDQFTLLSPLETMLTILWSVLFLKETLSLFQWIGAGTIIFGAGLTAFLALIKAGSRRIGESSA